MRPIVTIPNLLSLLRMILALTAAGLFIDGRFTLVAIILCAVGVLLDAVDGWCARRLGQCTEIGRHLDPLADKVLMAVVYGVIAARMQSPVIWFFFVLLTGRDVLVTLHRWRSLRTRSISLPAATLGKLKMIAQSVGGVWILVYGFVQRGGDFAFPVYPVVTLLAVTAILSLGSAARYWRVAIAVESRAKRRGGRPVPWSDRRSLEGTFD
jgi:CDP-diacylglycerol--glycerol-3-phosphate 3-phosphatidyltransferase/cardiolipin synthase